MFTTHSKGIPSRNRVDLARCHEIQYWSEKLGCTPAQLREAVAQVGDSADAVKGALKKRPSSPYTAVMR